MYQSTKAICHLSVCTCHASEVCTGFSLFTHPSVVSLIQLKEDRDNALERKYRELQQRNSDLEKQVVAKDTEIASMREAKEKLDDVLKAKEDEIKDLYGRLDSIVNVARPKRKFPWD